MNKKKAIILTAMVTAGSALMFGGCGFDLPGVSGSAGDEALVDGQIQIYSRWYNANNERLAGATVTFYDGEQTIYSGTTDASGSLEAFSLPCSTELNCVITDSAGTEIANSKLIYKLSGEYSSLTIFTIPEESDLQEIGIPLDKTDISAAIYVTNTGMITHANLSSYDPNASVTPEETVVDTDGDGQPDAPAEGDAAPTEGDGAAPAEGDGTAPAEGDGAAPAEGDGAAPTE